MLKNYIFIGWRNLVRAKGFSVLNILGLAAGMAVAITIGLWVNDEMSFDTVFPRYDRLGQVYHHITFGDETVTINDVPYPLGQELKESYTEFEDVAMTLWPRHYTLAVRDSRPLSKQGLFIEPAFMSLFSIPVVQGKFSNELHSIMLSESLAKTLFNGDATGQSLRFDNRDHMVVAGVFKDFPANSSFANVDMLMPINYFFSTDEDKAKQQNSWENYNFQCFVLMKDKSLFQQAASKIKKILFDKGSQDAKAIRPDGLILPMRQWHLSSTFMNGERTGGQMQFVWMFGIIGIFVLTLACINFMNLSTARSEKRAKEVGLRKALGSLRQQLVVQFLSESLLLVVISFAFAIALVCLTLPWFNTLAEKHIAMPWSRIDFLAGSLVFIVVTALLAGGYPALYLSSFRPVAVLKGKIITSRWSSVPRKAMVVFQFTISIALTIGTLVVFQQIRHAKNRPAGFDRKGILHIPVRTDDLVRATYNSLRADLLATGAVDNVAASDFPITGAMAADASLTWPGKDPASAPLVAINSCTHDFPKTNGFTFVHGRDFSRDMSTDSSAAIVNELAAQLMGGRDDVIGKKITFGGGKECEIVGVIKDQIRNTPFTKQYPHLYYVNYALLSSVSIRLAGNTDVHGALQKVEAVMRKYDPGSPFEYTFVDDDYARLFRHEEQLGKLATLFSSLAVLISCIGIFGLSAFAASRRTKEIGVRKVLGASVFSIWKMLSNDFVRLVLVAIAVATPLAYYAAGEWLQQYEYRIDLSWQIFAATGAMAIGITLLTISYQTLAAALSNPVKTLRSE